MTWSDKLQELQATLYANIIDFINEYGDNEYIRYDRETRDDPGHPPS